MYRDLERSFDIFEGARVVVLLCVWFFFLRGVLLKGEKRVFDFSLPLPVSREIFP